MSVDSVNQGSTVVTLVPEVCMNNRNFSEREIFIFKKQNIFFSRNNSLASSKRRLDAFGNEITKGTTKSHRVSFSDKISRSKRSELVTFVDVISFKRANRATKYKDNFQDQINEEKLCCNAPCIIY